MIYNFLWLLYIWSRPSCLYMYMEQNLHLAVVYGTSLIPRPSITANAVEDLIKLLRRMTSGGRTEARLIAPCMHTLGDSCIH